ncbi:MAG: hypothetical protein BGN88_06985 [Clostridiales bacterium 43-6]|nr:MAG: hypothetical protein BGN88_06985 [Clostridiales bacterium 43-6]
MKLRMVLIILLICILSGCSNSVRNMDSSKQVSGNSLVTTSSKELGFKFYKNIDISDEKMEKVFSPNKEHYISYEYSGTHEKLLYRFFEGDSDTVLYEQAFDLAQDKAPCEWLDNKCVLILGSVIYDIQSKNKEIIKINGAKTIDCFQYNYSMDESKKQISYLTYHKTSKDYEYIQKVSIYDIADMTCFKIFESKLFVMEYYVANVFWDSKMNVYFDYYSEKSYEANVKGFTSYKYQYDKKQLKVLSRDLIPLQITPDNKWLVLLPFSKNEKVIFRNIDSGTEKVVDFNGLLLTEISNIKWSEDKKNFCVYFGPDSMICRIYNFDDFKMVKEVDFSGIIKSINGNVNFDYVDNRFVIGIQEDINKKQCKLYEIIFG